MVDDQLVTKITNDLGELRFVRDQVEAFGRRNNLPSECVFDVKLVLCELLTNTISYGYEDEKKHTIDIRLRVEGGRVHLQITDDAISFDPTTAKDPEKKESLQDPPIGGLGIYLTKQLVDSFDYRRESGRNHIVFTKEIHRSHQV